MEDGLQIKEISSKDTLELRQKVLRPHQMIEDCVYPGDEDNTTFHLGAFENESLMGIVSVYQRNHETLDGKKGFQIRAMATVPEARGKGLAKALLECAEKKVMPNGASYTWANARTSAWGFYEKLGYQRMNEQCEIKGIGPHYLIYKVI